jgi:membrane associated rhomboid family serine protease
MPRRWPWITTAVIAANVLVFLATHKPLQREAIQHNEIESRTLVLASTHPQIPVTAPQQALIDAFRKAHPEDWNLMTSLSASPANIDEVREEVKALGQRLDAFQHDSLTARFGVYPLHRSLLSSFTANFLHRSWMHLILNMCFLWIVGEALEDLWGRRIYAAIALACGILAVKAYAIVYPGVLIPLIGASGLVAALMGVYVIRFPRIRIERGTALWFVRPRLLRFSSPVYVVFPIWLLCLMFWGKSALETTNAAYWGQGLALAIGTVLGLLLWITGIESHVSQAIETELGWSVDPHIASASEHLERGDLDSAINEVNAQIAEKPTSVEAHEMLVSLYSRKDNAVIKYLQALEALCEAHLNAPNPEAAWQVYQNYRQMGGRKMQAATWLQLLRFAEDQGEWERAVTEYEELAEAWPGERASVLALISAGRIQLHQFGRHEEAKQLYTAAQNSPVPHADWDQVIRKGLEKAGAAAPKIEPISLERQSP